MSRELRAGVEMQTNSEKGREQECFVLNPGGVSSIKCMVCTVPNLDKFIKRNPNVVSSTNLYHGYQLTSL